MQKIQTFFLKILEKETSYLTIALSFLGMVCLRVFVEHFLAISSPISLFEILIEIIHNSLFFGIAYLAIWIFLSLFLKIKPRKLSHLFLWGSFLVIFPPLIDMLYTRGAVFWSFYILNKPEDLLWGFLTFFGNLPSGIFYFGTKIIFFLSLFATAFLIYSKTKSYLKTFLGFLGVYSILFFMGAFPSFFFFFYAKIFDGKNLAEIQPFQILQFFVSSEKIFGFLPSVSKYLLVYNLDFIFFPLLIFLLLIFFFLESPQKLWAVFQNIRFPQIIYHGGMFFIGIGLSFLNHPENFHLNVFSLGATLTLLISVCLSWIASVFFNDLTDIEIDRVTNSWRPLPQKIFERTEYAKLGFFCFILAFLGALSVGIPFAVLILLYQFLAWLYSGASFRLKRFLGIATFTSAVASLLILFLGYILLSNDPTTAGISWRIILLILITYTISLPVKDFKDLEGDKKENIFTLPVVLGERKGRLVLSVNIFLSYMLSVFFINEMKLFFWALIFGIITFFVVNNEKIQPRHLPGWTLSVVSAYTFILIWKVFF